MYHKMTNLLQWIHASLVNSDIYKYLAVPKEPEKRHKLIRSSDAMSYSEMRESLVILDNNM